MVEQIMEKTDQKGNIFIEEFEYFLVFFSFNDEYNLAKKQKLLRFKINSLLDYYFPNMALSLASNAIVIKQNKHSGTAMIERYIENALWDDDDDKNFDYSSGFRIIESYDISYFIIPVDFKDTKKYLVNYKDSLLSFFEKIKC